MGAAAIRTSLRVNPILSANSDLSEFHVSPHIALFGWQHSREYQESCADLLRSTREVCGPRAVATAPWKSHAAWSGHGHRQRSKTDHMLALAQAISSYMETHSRGILEKSSVGQTMLTVGTNNPRGPLKPIVQEPRSRHHGRNSVPVLPNHFRIRPKNSTVSTSHIHSQGACHATPTRLIAPKYCVDTLISLLLLHHGTTIQIPLYRLFRMPCPPVLCSLRI